MKKPILDRYARTDDGCVAIDVSTNRAADLYNNFDKTTPFAKKELDDDLVEYLVDSVQEIGPEDFVFRFYFPEADEPQLQSRIQASMKNYFLYLRELESRALGSMLRRSLVFFLAGCFLLLLSIQVNTAVTGSSGIFMRLLAEGLTISSWIALWESVALLLVNWLPGRKRIAMFGRMSAAPVQFGSAPAPGKET